MGASPGIEHMVGDKVGVRGLDGTMLKGVIARLGIDSVVVRLDGNQEFLEAPRSQLRNFSLAARKAWASMPNRNVGRPKGTSVSNRVSVTLRVDKDLWDQFRFLQRTGKIGNRVEAIESCLRSIMRGLSNSD